jgi:hypothetical protein
MQGRSNASEFLTQDTRYLYVNGPGRGLRPWTRHLE